MKSVEKYFKPSALASICGGEFIVRSERQVQFVESDSRRDCRDGFFFAFVGEKFDGHAFVEKIISAKAAAICVSRELSQVESDLARENDCAVILVEDTIVAYQKAAKYLIDCQGPKVVAITGSTGKTSIKTICGALLEKLHPNEVLATAANTNNHIGVPQNIFRLEPQHKFCILEMGTSSPGEIAILAQIAAADVAVLCNIGSSHIGNFGDRADLAQEKSEIFSNLKEGGKAITTLETLETLKKNSLKYPHDSLVTVAESKLADIQLHYSKSDFSGAKFTVTSDGVDYDCQTQMSGRHQALNCAIAIAVMRSLELPLSFVEEALRDVKLPGMRMLQQKVGERLFINDAYNANSQSMIAALEWLAEVFPEGREEVVVVLGDMLELGSLSAAIHKELRPLIKANFRLFVVGSCMAEALGDLAKKSFENSSIAGEYLLKEVPNSAKIFLKASRGMKLESIVSAFENNEKF